MKKNKKKNNDKQKTILILTIVALIIALVAGGTYAWWTWVSGNNTNVNITVKGMTMILDGGECRVGVESTIVGFDEEDEKTINVFRLGGITVENLKSVMRGFNIVIKGGNYNLPGNAKLHYSTNKPLILGNIDELLLEHKDKKIGVLSFQKDYNAEFQFILSERGNLEEAAQNLYKGMQILDAMPVDIILTELVPDNHIGRAINDRLIRASAK